MKSMALSPFALILLTATVMSADHESAPRPRRSVNIDGYKTVSQLQTADPKLFTDTTTTAAAPGYLGIMLESENDKVVIAEVEAESPAEIAGLQPKDQLIKIDGKPITTLNLARESLRGQAASSRLRLEIQRNGKTLVISPLLAPISKPFSVNRGNAVMGLVLDPPTSGMGAAITRITMGGGAERAGLKVGDVILRANDLVIENHQMMIDWITRRQPGEVVQIAYRRDKDTRDVAVTLGSDEARAGVGGRMGGNAGWDDRIPRAWNRSSYKLAIIGIEYSDIKHNDKIRNEDWNQSMFSVGTYNDKSVTGQKVHGSLADYYHEISYGKLKVEGQFVGWVEVSKKRLDYSTGSGVSVREKTALLTEVMDKLLAKDKNALKDVDGIFFLFAGGRVQTTRGSLYWPHRSSFRHQNKSWPYFIVQEGGDTMTNISVFCHEFGHMLGLPDLYARPEVPGMEGVGVWCAMSQQLPNGRPQHFSAWCKEQLGWIKPTMIDPRVKQKVVLGSITESPSECVKVPLRSDGTEYLLLENRTKRGFDRDLPAEGLLIWRVVRAQGSPQPVFLEESHGIEGASGPRQFPGAVPFPSPANHAFTPHTTPSSKSQLGGGFDVYITNIQRLPDGKIAFKIGHEYH